jgi:hypothetical protein
MKHFNSRKLMDSFHDFFPDKWENIHNQPKSDGESNDKDEEKKQHPNTSSDT